MHIKIYPKGLFSILFCISISLFSLHAQDEQYKVVTVDGRNFYEYVVRTGEGLYAVSRNFSVSVADLLRHNPGAERGLQNGQKLLVPVNEANKILMKSPAHSSNHEGDNSSRGDGDSLADQNRTFFHTVVRGETVYGIAKMYQTTVDELYRLNPFAREGIAEGRQLTIPQRRVISREKEENYRYHTISPKETLYSVSKTYSLKPEDILRANPGLSPETFQIGKTIRVPFFESYEVILPYEEQKVNIIHKVAKGETLYSIANQYGTNVDDIKQFNSALSGGLKTGMELIIPVSKLLVDKESPDDINAANQLLNNSTRSEKVDVIKVGLLLPFLDETKGSHYRLQEYYEGFLMAVDQMKDEGANIELYVFEIGKGDDTRKLKSLLGTIEMQSLNLIIGGVNDSQSKILSDFSLSRNIKYVVPFSQSNGEVFTNGNIFQVNPIPHQTLVKAADVFLKNFRNANIFFVQKDEANVDEFIPILQDILKKNNVKFETLSTATPFAGPIAPLLNNKKDNVIVPTSPDTQLLRQVLDELLKVRNENPQSVIRLFGYPDWQTYASLKNDYSLFGTYFFAPFFVNEQSASVDQFKRDFQKWYGKDMLDTYPNYGLWGYDTGLFFLRAIYKYGDHFEQSIDKVNVPSLQFPFHFERPNNWGGFVNTGLFLVYYDTDGKIIKKEID